MTGSAAAAPPDHPARTAALLALAGTLLNAAYLDAGWALDDFILVSVFRQDPLPFSRLLGFWSIQEVKAFDSLWWMGEGWAGTFWRPLPSLVVEASLRLFGETAVPLHAVAIGCHAAVGAGLYLLVRNLTGRAPLAILSALFFLGCERLGLVVGWVATMTDPLCMAFLVPSLLLHVEFLQRRRRLALAGSLLLLALAFACKESAVLAPVLIALLSFFAPDGRMPPDGLAGPVRARAVRLLRDVPAWLPATAMLAVYLGAYRALDLGRVNNLAYASPLVDPEGYAVHLVQHLPAMWLGSLTSVWPSLQMFDPALLPALAIAGALVLASFLPALVPLRCDPLVVWGLGAWLVALLPQVSADASERGLYVPMFVLAPVLAAVAIRIGPLARRLAPEAPPAPLFTRLWGWYLAAGLLVPGLVMTAAFPPMMKRSFSQGEREMVTALPHVRSSRAEHVVFVTTSGFLVGLYPQSVLEFHREAADVRVLSAANGAFSVERAGDAALVLRVDRPGWLSNFFARLVRTDPVLRAGQVFDEGLFRATLLELTPDARDARAVRFDFAVPLADPSLLFLVWNGTAFEPLELGALPAGERRALHDTSDVWAGMM